jgi:hypothetical protein
VAGRQFCHGYGVEHVDPFCDVRLARFVLAVPADQLRRANVTKRILRQAMSGTLPAPVVNRSGKASFQALLEKGLRANEGKAWLALLTDSEIVSRGFVRETWLRDEAERARRGAYPGIRSLLMCIGLELWLQRYWQGRRRPDSTVETRYTTV